MSAKNRLLVAALCGLMTAYGLNVHDQLLAAESENAFWGDGKAISGMTKLYEDDGSHRQGARNPRIIVSTKGTILAFGTEKVRRSRDGGKSWDAARRSVGNRQVVDEENGDVLSVALKEGCLWRSSDDGETWKKEAIVVKPNAAMQAAGGAGTGLFGALGLARTRVVSLPWEV